MIKCFETDYALSPFNTIFNLINIHGKVIREWISNFGVMVVEVFGYRMRKTDRQIQRMSGERRTKADTRHKLLQVCLECLNGLNG